MDKLRSIYASAWSAAVTVVLVVALTIGAELSPAFKGWLAGFTGHHWVTKSWASILAFVLLFIIFRALGKSARDNIARVKNALLALEVIVILGFLAILVFYIYEFLAH
jgi:hypothetical protein